MHRYALLLAAVLMVCAGSLSAQNADTVDGFDAYSIPHANALLALNASARMSGAVIADNSIPGSRLVPGAVTAGRLGNNSVTTDKISDGQVMSADLAAGAVTRTKIANGAVTTTRIADQAVTGGKLAYGAVTAGRLADNSVSSSKIIDGAIMGEDVHIPLLVGGSRDGYLIGCFNGSSGGSTSGITGYSTAASGNTRGVVGASSSTSGKGVYGVATATSGSTFGVYGDASASNSGYGLYGVGGYIGAYLRSYRTSGAAYGLYARTDSPSGYGVCGYNSSTGNQGDLGGPSYGVFGYNLGSRNEGHLAGADEGARGWNYDSENYGYLGGANYGVYGYHDGSHNYGYLGGLSYGVYGRSHTTYAAVCGSNTTNDADATGVYGSCPDGYGGYFTGKCYVSGRFDCPDKHFKIDHPLDPENMYLDHACVESSERKNVYDGTVVLDQRGEAWIALPDWFEALNCDFRYQLTPIGAPGPNLYIAQKIANGCFAIAGGTPGMEVCWMVTGVRHDPYALAHPMQVEVEKPEIERGSYMHPELYGMPDTMSVEWARYPEAMMEVHETR
jgi:hypothetical protein